MQGACKEVLCVDAVIVGLHGPMRMATPHGAGVLPVRVLFEFAASDGRKLRACNSPVL